MIVIKLGFLIALPLNYRQSEENDSHLAKKNNKNVKKGKKEKKTTSKSEPLMKNGMSKLEINVPDLPPYGFFVGNPKGYYHIEYAILAGVETTHIDILHWGAFSKVYFGQQVAIYRNVIRGETIWIPIMIEHSIRKSLNTDELYKLRHDVIEFIVSPNKRNIGTNAKNEKTSVFYLKINDLKKTSFVQAFEDDPNIRKSTKSGVAVSEKRANQDKVILHQFDKHFMFPKLEKILKKLDNDEPIAIKKLLPSPPEPVDEEPPEAGNENNVSSLDLRKLKLGRTSKERKNLNEVDAKQMKNKINKETAKSKEKTNEVKLTKEARVPVSSECFLTDASLCIVRLNEAVEGITDAFIALSVTDLTTRHEIQKLRPLVIKLKTLTNLPIQVLLANNIKEIYVQYNIPKIARHVGNRVELKNLKENAKKLKICEGHVYFDIPHEDFQYFLQSSRLIVELMGVHSDEGNIKPQLFGKTSNWMNNYSEEKPIIVKLAVACYDLSLLRHSGSMELQLNEQFHHPGDWFSQSSSCVNRNHKFSDPLTLAQINFVPSPLEDAILNTNETFLKIQVMHIADLSILEESSDETKFRRLFFVMYDMELATILLNTVELCNNELHPTTIRPNYVNYVKNLSQSPKNDDDMVTGFWIDNGTSVIAFLEGVVDNLCLENVWQEISCLSANTCTCHANTGHAFHRRIYENFLAFGGVYKITLAYPIQRILKLPKAHLSTCIPTLARHALANIEYMMHLKNSAESYRRGMIPTANQLLSLNMEFGIRPIILETQEEATEMQDIGILKEMVEQRLEIQ